MSVDDEKINRKREQARLRQQRRRARLRAGMSSPHAGKAILAGSQITAAAQSPLMPSIAEYVMRSVDGHFYEALREGIPICDAAIRRLINLTGTPKIIGDNMELVKLLEDFHLNVPVNDMEKGLVAFAANSQNETFEQGFSVSEFVANRARDDIDRIVVADSKRIIFRRNKAGRAEPWIRTGNPISQTYTMPGSVIQQILDARYGQTIAYNGIEETRLTPDNKIYFSIGNENQNPYGVSIFRSMEFVAQILVTLQNSIKNAAERFGDPAFHAHYKGKAGAVQLEERRIQLEDALKKVIGAKRAGKSGDITTAGGPDSEVRITVIGHEGQLFDYNIPLRHVLEQIVSKTNLAAWMLGIYWSTTERMATLEVEMALADAKIRQYAMLPEYIRLLSSYLRLRGRTWNTVTTSLDQPGDWGIIFETPNVRDLVAMAQAEMMTAQAAMMRRNIDAPSATTVGSQDTQAPARAASFDMNGIRFEVKTQAPTNISNYKPQPACSCSKDHLHRNNCVAESCTDIVDSARKELSRPIPWPELDEWERKYEQTLSEDWALLKNRVFDILTLETPEEKDAGKTKAFSFNDAQRAAIFKALRDYLGWYSPDNDDSSVRWYYGQSYSLGLIQAANLIGKERPLLDILKNKEIYADLVANGFQLVKDNATRVIKNEIIDAMEYGVTQGINPKDMALMLSQIFDDQNSNWERLARTEMSMAAERAKLDEWKARGIDVKGLYRNDGRAIVPVHPRCRCSITVMDDGNGNFRALFAPAPDACPWCLSYQEGT